MPHEGICRQSTVVVTISFKQEDAQEMSGTHFDVCRVKDVAQSLLKPVGLRAVLETKI